MKVEKVDPVKDHKEDIREAFSGHVKVNISKTAGPIPEKAKETPDPTPQSIEAKSAISGNLDKNGKNIAKLATEKSNKTAEKPSTQPAPKTAAPAAKPANKSIESPKTPSAAKPTLVTKRVAQFSSHSTSPFFEERHH